MKKPSKPNAAILVSNNASEKEVYEAIRKEREKDLVNHPPHYETGQFECIDVMCEVFGNEAVKHFCLVNAFKYLYRCKRKNNTLEDIEKAIWYLNKYIEKEGGNNG